MISKNKDLKSALGSALKPSCEKYGFVTYRIITYWSQIVGASLAALCFPLEITFPRSSNDDGLLIIGVDNPGFALDVQSNEESILNNIASYFGYRAIGRVRIKIARRQITDLKINSKKLYGNGETNKKNLEIAEWLIISEQDNIRLNNLIGKIKNEDLALEMTAFKNSLFKVQN